MAMNMMRGDIRTDGVHVTARGIENGARKARAHLLRDLWHALARALHIGHGGHIATG